MYLTDLPKDKFTCKKELYDILVERKFPYLNKDDYFEMGFLICHKTKEPKLCDGILSRSTEEDRNTLNALINTKEKENKFKDRYKPPFLNVQNFLKFKL